MNKDMIRSFGAKTFKRNPHATFQKLWEDHLPEGAIRTGKSGRVTSPIQNLLEVEESKGRRGEFIEASRRKASGMQATSGNGICGATPLAFDPEVVSIYTDEAPALMEIPSEGYDGFVIQVNRIDNIQDPIGFTTEADAQDLSNNDLSGLQMQNSQFDMKIYADTLEVTDFSQQGSSHYMNLRETALGDRLAAHARWKERAVLYGSPGCGATNGNIFSTASFSGIASYATEVDKSGVSLSSDLSLLEDIKSEIKTLFQSQYNVSKNDYTILCSHDMHDALENQLSPGTRVDINTEAYEFGFQDIAISQIPVIPTHNIRNIDDGTYSRGDVGDVFLVNKRDMRYRALAPLTTIPLGRLGLADRMGIYEYGTLVTRSDGNFSRYLSAYDI